MKYYPRVPQVEVTPRLPTPNGGTRSLGPQPAITRPAPALLAFRKPTGLQTVGFYAFALFLFFYYSRLLDFVLPYLHLPLVVAVIAGVATLMSGRLVKSMTSPVGALLAFLTFWFTLGVATSIWRGGSFNVLKQEWTRAVLVFPLAASLIVTSTQALKSIRITAFATLVAAGLALAFQFHWEGRLGLPTVNPNDLARVLLFGICCAWFVSHNRNSSVLVRVFGFVSILVMAFVMLKTGSRAAEISAILILPALFFYYSPLGRIRFVIASILITVGIILVLPSSSLYRLTVLFEADEPATYEEASINSEAIGSTQSRFYLLRQSIDLTLRNPIFGVGVGMFVVAEDKDAKAVGRSGNWHGTHNTFTETSSEAGIPALLALVGILIFSWRDLRRLKANKGLALHPHKDEIKLGIMTLKLIFWSSVIGACFAHFTYSPVIPALAAQIYAFCRSVREEIAELEGAGLSSPRSA